MATFKDWIKRKILDKTRLDEMASAYVKGRILDPAREATRLRESGETKKGFIPKAKRGLNLLSAGFSATPMGLGFNVAESGLTSLLHQARTTPKDQPAFGGYKKLLGEMERNLGSYDSGIFSRGLGVKGGWGLAGDILLDPDSAPGTIAALTKGSKALPDLLKFSNKADSISDILKGKKAEDIVEASKKFPMKPDPKVPKAKPIRNAILNNIKDPKDRKIAKTVSEAFSLQGKKSYKLDKTEDFVPYLVDQIGGKKVKELYDKHLKYPKTDSIKRFMNDAKTELSNIKGRKRFDEWTEAVVKGENKANKTVSDILKDTQKVSDKVDDVVEEVYRIAPEEVAPAEYDAIIKLGFDPDNLTEKQYKRIAALEFDSNKGNFRNKKIIEDLIPEKPKYKVNPNKPLAPQFKKDVPLKEKLKQVEPAVTSRFKELDKKLSKIGMSREEFGDIVSKTKPSELPVSLKPAMAELKKITDDLAEISKTKFNKRSDYGFARVWEGDRTLRQVIPDTWVSVMNSRFTHALPRKKNAQGFINDPLQAMIDYTERAVMDRHADEIMAEAQKISLKEARDRIKLGDKLSTAKQKDKLSDIDIVANFKKIWKNHNKGKTGTIKLKGNFNTIDFATDTHISNLKKLGIYDVFEDMNRWRSSARRKFDVLSSLVGSGKYDDAMKYARIQFPELEGFPLLIDNFVKANDENSYMAAYRNLEKAIKKAEYQKVASDFERKLVALNFSDNQRAKNYVNKLAGKMLTQGITERDAASKVSKFMQKTFASGLLGGKLSTIMQQVFEAKRLVAETDINDISKGFKKTVKELQETGNMQILKKYGKEQSEFAEFFNIGKAQYPKGALGKLDQVQDFTLTPMMKADKFKNAWFLHTFEEMADAKNLSGKKKMDYVLGKFENLAHTYSGLDVIDMFENKWIKLALQFSHYTIKDLRLVQRKIKSGDLRYLSKLAAMNTAMLMVGSKLFGWGFDQTFFGSPSAGPIKDFVDDTWQLVGDLARERKEEDPMYGKILAAYGIDTGSSVIPAGNQINKSTEAIVDTKRGFSASPTGMVRFPVSQKPLDVTRNVTFGITSSPEWAEYSDVNRNLPYGINRMIADRKKVLGENQTEYYKDIFENDPERAKEYYNRLQGDRELSTEKPDFSPSGQLTDIDSDRPTSIYDIVTSEKELSKKRNLITSVMTGEEKGSGENMQERIQFLKDVGITQEDVKDWEVWKMSNLPNDRKVELIMNMDEIDFVDLYKKEVISLDVLKKLEEKGFITNPDELWEKLKLTNPNYSRKKSMKLKLDYKKDLAKLKAETKIKQARQVQKYKNKTMKEILSNKKGTTLKLPKLPSASSIKIKVPKLDPYKPYDFPEL